MHTERHGVSLLVRFECGKMQPKNFQIWPLFAQSLFEKKVISFDEIYENSGHKF